MDTKKIIELAHELKTALPFSDGITLKNCTTMLTLMDELVEDAVKNDLLIDYLFPIIERYGETTPNF